MAYLLSPLIRPKSPGMWGEGDAYEKRNIYSVEKGKPPVNYDEHIIRPHSLTHLETPAHTIKDGKRLESYFEKDLRHFYGKTLVLKISNPDYVSLGNGVFHKIISKPEIIERLENLKITTLPPKLLITTENYPTNPDGFHDPNFVLTLSQEAADFLVSSPGFNLYGTSWKSSDYNPGLPGRPIHNTLFEKAVILENLDLQKVNEGIYFMTAIPLPLVDSSESPVAPALFTYDEILSY